MNTKHASLAASKDDPRISPFARRAAAVCDWFAHLSRWGWAAVAGASLLVLGFVAGGNAGDPIEAAKIAVLENAPRVTLLGRVQKVLGKGLIIESLPSEMPTFVGSRGSTYGLGGPKRQFGSVYISDGPEVYYLSGHPDKAKLGVGETIRCYAVRDGVQQFEGTENQLAKFRWMPEPKKAVK